MDVTFTIDLGAAPGSTVHLDLNADLPVDVGNFDPDVQVPGDFDPGTYTETVAFADGDVSGGWSNGDLNILGIRAQNVAGQSYANYTIPIWLGDIITFDNFEADPNIFFDPTLTLTDNPNDYWAWNQFGPGQTTRPRWTPTGSRPHFTYHPNMGSNAIHVDNNTAPYTYIDNLWGALFMPEQNVPSNDDIFIHTRSAGLTEANFDYITATSALWGPGFGDGNNFGIVFAFGQHGNNTTAVVRSTNISQVWNSIGWPWKSATNQYRGGYLLYTDFIVTVNPGGMVFDNLLQTHASTTPPYL
jgi:hypothetical protein